MTMITPSYLGETIEYSSLHACRSTLEDPTSHGFRAIPYPCLGLWRCRAAGLPVTGGERLRGRMVV